MDAYLKEDLDVDEDSGGIQLGDQTKRSLAGTTASSFSRFMVQPFDIVKARFQQRPEGSIWQAMREIRATEGISALWRANYISQMLGLTHGLVQFSCYSELREAFHYSRFSDMPSFCDFFAGALSGTACVLLLAPLDYTRTLVLQRPLDGKALKAREISRQTFEKNGIRGFYHGAFVALFHVSLLTGLRFMIYNDICRIAMYSQGVKTHAELSPPLLLFSGAGAGLIPYAATYPVEVVNKRMQVTSARNAQSTTTTTTTTNTLDQNIIQCKRTLKCAMDIISTEGPRALYRGFVPSSIRSVLNIALQFSCYDMFFEWFDNLRF